MSPALHYDCTRVPVTALASCAPVIIAGEGPYIRIYRCQDFLCIATIPVFEAQAQAIHGITVVAESYSKIHDHVLLLIRGGQLVRALELRLCFNDYSGGFTLTSSLLSKTAKAPDWLLDLSSKPQNLQDDFEHGLHQCAAVTAHNALVELKIERIPPIHDHHRSTLEISISALTLSSRSILYSAHLLWETEDRILVAAGTAFGEIMYWSWTRNPETGSRSRIHRVFLGHEGSIFGVQISKDLNTSHAGPKRLLASCSDDRTIRIWDISDISTDDSANGLSEDLEVQRTRHTGFSNASFDTDSSTSACLGIGWGHISRVWTVKFLDMPSSTKNVFLLSSGEDASSRTWMLCPGTGGEGNLPYKLVQTSIAAYHSGKNLWSTVVYSSTSRTLRILCGGADSKITAYNLPPIDILGNVDSKGVFAEYTTEDISSTAHISADISAPTETKSAYKSSKMSEFFRSYSFIGERQFLLTTNLGKIYIESLSEGDNHDENFAISNSQLVDQPEELAGYSTCTGEISLGVAFIASSRGSIFMYYKQAGNLTKIHTVTGKVGDLHIAKVSNDSDAAVLVLLITLVGQKTAQLLFVEPSKNQPSPVLRVVTIPISELLTGFTITSMAYNTTTEDDYILLGYRRGSVAAYCIPRGSEEAQATLFRIIEKLHGNETVTSLSWIPSCSTSHTGYLLSVGRDGCVAIHWMNLAINSVSLVHNLALPIGPNIEGLYFENDHLLVYGFSSKQFVLYDVTAEEEIMRVETGGAHRSWDFQPCFARKGGGTLVWTRASSMHICSQIGSNHAVVTPGRHGREIKAVAISHAAGNGDTGQLIATGAEDTDIKLLENIHGDLLCRRTLRKHTTGIQYLQWSDDGEYLFSSGGCEEFYIWRIRTLPSFIGIGVVCESVYAPESEHSDLRIMSFDAKRRGTGFIITMVFSDSNIKIYSYDPTVAVKWQTLAKGEYFTSCITQCAFISINTILTAGTDGHAVIWPLPSSIQRPHACTPSTPNRLTWQNPTQMHQNTSKTLALHALTNETTLLVSGGDDGSFAFIITSSTLSDTSESVTSSTPSSHICRIKLEERAHASAVTACSIILLNSKILILTSGTDQWLRLWKIVPDLPSTSKDGFGLDMLANQPLQITQLSKIKTNVADVSSMAVLYDGTGTNKSVARVLICGVGMEIVRIQH